jgi:small subunit ribosomal protein S4
VREKSREQIRIKDALGVAEQFGFSEWIDVDVKKMSGVFRTVPERDEVLQDVNENLIVELYSK